METYPNISFVEYSKLPMPKVRCKVKIITPASRPYIPYLITVFFILFKFLLMTSKIESDNNLWLILKYQINPTLV
jgi:hypothetical protein